MKSIVILLFLSLLASTNHRDINDTDSFIGSWTMATSSNEASNMEVCHRFGFRLEKEGKGNLSIELSLPNEPNNFDMFLARIPFTYEQVETATNEYKQQIKVKYTKVEFEYLQYKRYQEQAISIPFKNYVKEIERSLSYLEADYHLSIDGHNYLVIEGFSLLKNSAFANFKKGGVTPSCNDLK